MERPEVKIIPALADKILVIAGGIALAALWLIVIYAYNKMPDIVPIHFNGAGQPDGFGPKRTVFILPVIGTLIFMVLTAISASPHTFNYPVTITEENASGQYAIAVRMIHYLKFGIMLIFAGIEFYGYKVATGQQESLGEYFLVFMFAILFIPMAFFLIKAFNSR